MISEKEHEEIRKEAKRILDNFASSLQSVKLEKSEVDDSRKGFREELESENCDSSFRKIMFENAPSKEGGFLIAEKKKW